MEKWLLYSSAVTSVCSNWQTQEALRSAQKLKGWCWWAEGLLLTHNPMQCFDMSKTSQKLKHDWAANRDSAWRGTCWWMNAFVHKHLTSAMHLYPHLSGLIPVKNTFRCVCQLFLLSDDVQFSMICAYGLSDYQWSRWFACFTVCSFYCPWNYNSLYTWKVVLIKVSRTYGRWQAVCLKWQALQWKLSLLRLLGKIFKTFPQHTLLFSVFSQSCKSCWSHNSLKLNICKT